VAGILRGDILWADLDPAIGQEQKGMRPVLVLSHEIFNRKSGTAITMALTSQEPSAGYPLTYEIKASGLPKRSWVKMGQIRTLSTLRLKEKITQIDSEQLSVILDGFREIIGP